MDDLTPKLAALASDGFFCEIECIPTQPGQVRFRGRIWKNRYLHNHKLSSQFAFTKLRYLVSWFEEQAEIIRKELNLPSPEQRQSE